MASTKVCTATYLTYDLETGRPATHCAKCAKGSKLFNVRTKMCVGGCKQCPSYGLETGKPAGCAGCAGCAKRSKMFNVRMKMCEGCSKTQPSYGLVWDKTAHCVFGAFCTGQSFLFPLKTVPALLLPQHRIHKPRTNPWTQSRPLYTPSPDVWQWAIRHQVCCALGPLET